MYRLLVVAIPNDKFSFVAVHYYSNTEDADVKERNTNT